MSQNIVYKTYEINTDVEHYAKPINLSGASTVKLTELPAGVKCWISTESTGENKFPLINRGDGWVNLPAPLYDLYIYTEGTTLENQKIILNYTGQNDFFVYGNNSSEKIEQIGQIVSLSKQTIKDVNDAVYNTYMKNVVARFLIRGSWSLKDAQFENVRICYLPMGKDGKIADLGLDNNKYYRITTQGHFDLGNGALNFDDVGTETTGHYPRFSTTAHFSVFNETNGAQYTELTSPTSGGGLYFDFDKIYQLDKSPWATSKDEFNLWGGKHKEYCLASDYWAGAAYQLVITHSSSLAFSEGVFNFGSADIMASGEVLNYYQKFGLFWTLNCVYIPSTKYSYVVEAIPNCHASLIIEVSEVIS